MKMLRMMKKWLNEFLINYLFYVDFIIKNEQIKIVMVQISSSTKQLIIMIVLLGALCVVAVVLTVVYGQKSEKE